MSPPATRLASAAAALAVAVVVAGNVFAERPNAVAQWWAPGEGRTLPATTSFANEHGRTGILNASGAIDTRGQPFFEPLGTNGRACVTCHQPADAMSLSVDSARARWDASGGKDPLFAAIDGANCPHLPQTERASHSLLLDRGLIRVFLPWPPRARAGSVVEPEFTLEVVRDPTGCNTHPVYGLKSATPTVSVYRRPRPAANLKYVTAAEFGVTPFSFKDSRPAQRDPATGKLVNMNMMADAREPTLTTQAVSAALTHLEMPNPPAANVLERIVGFESQIYAAQELGHEAGDLTEPGGPPALGPRRSPPAERPCSATTPRRTYSRSATYGARCRATAMRHTMRRPRRASRLRAATTCSSSARSGSRTRCTSTRWASATPSSARAPRATACT